MQIDLELYREDIEIHEPPIRLSAIDVNPEAAQHTIVFVHGFGGRSTQWEKQMRFFSDENRVIAIDLRGHGYSSAPDSSYSMDEVQSDLDAALAKLNVPDKFVLIGHSFGGAIAATYAERNPQRLEKLILIATAGEFTLNSFARLAFKLPVSVLNVIRPLTGRAFSANAYVLKAFHNHNMAQFNGWSMFRNITVPTLVITGHRDKVFTQSVFEEVAQKIPNAQHVTVPASAHMVILERSEAVNRAIQRFINEIPTRRGQTVETARAKLLRERVWLKHYEESVPFTISLPDRPVHRFLRSAARRFPNRVAIKFYGRSITYRSLSAEADRFANALRDLGVQRGDRVMILLPNIPQTVIAYYGILRIGAVVVFTSPTNSEDEIARQVKDSGAKVLIGLTRFATMINRVKGQAQLDHIVLTHIKDYLPSIKKFAFNTRRSINRSRAKTEIVQGAKLWSRIIQNQKAIRPDVQVGRNELAVIIYTGGTSDQPKGVMLSHGNLVANALQTRHWITDLREGHETFLCALPFSHSYGLSATLNAPVMIGATMVLLPTFITEDVLKTIKREKPTLFPGVPTMYMAINNYRGVRNFGIRSIRACISGAAPLPVEVQEAFEKLTRGRLVEGYGLTEASPITHGNPLNGLRKIGSIGIPFPSTEAKIVDIATGQDLPAGHTGELVVRGPQVMLGYWGNDDETDRVLHTANDDRGPWLYTEDIATMDEDGYFTIINRKKDMILAGEYQVYPRDVEEVLFEHPKVKEAVVLGVPLTPVGQKVKAFVVLREGEKATPDELLAMCRARLAEWEVPWEIEFRKELPKSFVGKVLRRVLIEEENQSNDK
jgi:long-chain acyl-CoA synthetase